ncbi:MAG: hypothetical protein P4M05_17435 [Bradyrhizobium sp.]|nr:hypothetical protein [Bradyrhizobium sp.]
MLDQPAMGLWRELAISRSWQAGKSGHLTTKIPQYVQLRSLVEVWRRCDHCGISNPSAYIFRAMQV